jgi:hypothetical protein
MDQIKIGESYTYINKANYPRTIVVYSFNGKSVFYTFPERTSVYRMSVSSFNKYSLASNK